MGSELESYFVAELSIGAHKEEVGLSDITMETATACVPYHIRPYQKGILQIHSYRGDELISSFKPVKVLVELIKRTNGVDGSSYCQLKFISMVSAGHGIVQLLHSIIYIPKKDQKPDTKPINKSLRVEVVSCRVCGRANIPFYLLKKGAVETQANIFGVPKYIHAHPGRDFCDYNLIQVTVCPSCSFASNDINEYLRESGEEGNKKSSFDPDEISTQWLKNKAERKTRIDQNARHFFDGQRKVEQAILSYQLAIETCDQIFKIDEHRKPRSRNYNPMRKSLFYLVVKAELQISSGHKKQAEETLKEVIHRSEFLFPLLVDEASIRLAYLLGMLNIYFEEHTEAGKYLTFLNEYNKNDGLEYGSKLHSALMLNTKKFNEVFQDRNAFSREKLTGFAKPY